MHFLFLIFIGSFFLGYIFFVSALILVKLYWPLFFRVRFFFLQVAGGSLQVADSNLFLSIAVLITFCLFVFWCILIACQLQVAGGRWQVAGGRWQVVVGRWQVAGGSTPTVRLLPVHLQCSYTGD